MEVEHRLTMKFEEGKGPGDNSVGVERKRTRGSVHRGSDEAAS